eukprot:Skav209881  [mRNA]  locus=scaffold3263:48214:50720:+ [translate_table: standard]
MAYNNRGFRYVGLNVLLVRECSIYRRSDGLWKYAEAEELKREVGFVLMDTAKQLFSGREMRHLWILLWLGLLLCVNEFIVKKLVAEPRPGSMMELRGRHGLLEGSCVEKCGMPSSHSAIAVGWLTLSILDAVSRTVSRADSILDAIHSYTWST